MIDLTNPWDIIGWVVIFIALVIVGSYVWFFASKWGHQQMTNYRRRRAHAGKVKCDAAYCEKTSVRETPLGYYCSDHWLENVKRPTYRGGVSWSHILNHAMKGDSDAR